MSDAATPELTVRDLVAILDDGERKIHLLSSDLNTLAATTEPEHRYLDLHLELSLVLARLAQLQLTAGNALAWPNLDELDRAAILTRLRKLQHSTWKLMAAIHQVFPDSLA